MKYQGSTTELYKELTPFYHLVYPDWAQSSARQAAQLDKIIRENWGDAAQTILDAACGIGTQTLGLAALGYQVTASDLSEAAIERARQEAEHRGFKIPFSVADMRQAYAHHQRQFDVVMACDNAVPHLLSDADLLQAFEQFYQCTRIGGGVILSVRDYDRVDRSGVHLKPEGVRLENGQRYIMFQVWEFDGDIYDLSIYIVKDEGGRECTTQVMRGQYYSVGTDKLLSLLRQAGYDRVRRLDDVFFQPVLIGTRSQ